uniref:T-cell receptor alpha/delta variable 36.2.12 n=1 Tax=Sinocyclocheilus grahami TaxID=75366 RepID=A0A672PCN7_SINGR
MLLLNVLIKLILVKSLYNKILKRAVYTHSYFYSEGSNVTLSCSHSPAATDYIHWYRQYERSKPEFLVLSFAGAKKAEVSDVDPRFSVTVEKREQIHVDLKISSAAVSDSALYYCALAPTVTGNTSVSYKNLLQWERRGTQRKRKRQ